MLPTLDPVEVRVVGALAEKALTTPDAYPLSLNALVTACNQKTGREPVMELTEDEVAHALDRLIRQGLAGTSGGAGSRVEKYRHLLDHAFGLDQAELAALAVLLLRGFQTVGEVRGRTGRMFEFESLEEAEAALRRLVGREDPIVQELPLQPGRKEPRYAHLLGGSVDVEAEPVGAPAAASAMRAARAEGDRVAALEGRVAVLETELEALREAFQAFRDQFE